MIRVEGSLLSECFGGPQELECFPAASSFMGTAPAAALSISGLRFTSAMTASTDGNGGLSSAARFRFRSLSSDLEDLDDRRLFLFFFLLDLSS